MIPALLPHITHLMLSEFRNYPRLNLSVSHGLVALVGENGAGKTNLLEALSLFSPGRGLRRSELADITRNDIEENCLNQGFAVSITLETDYGEKQLGTGVTPSEDQPSRMLRLNRVDRRVVSSTLSFAEYVRLLWLTPDMDGLFRGSAGERRRFFDRLVLAIDAEHGSRVNALEKALRARNRILEENPDQFRWLDAIEREIAELGIAVSLARKEAVDRLSSLIQLTRDDASSFPFAVLEFRGEIDNLVALLPAVDAEEQYRALLRQNRIRDKAAGRTLIGPQSSDLLVRHGPKDIAAEQASTGEQKALLIGLVLAQAQLIKTMSGIAPFVLLDEIAAHLDVKRRGALFDTLEAFCGQVWVTGADSHVFKDLIGRADVLEVRDGKVHPIC